MGVPAATLCANSGLTQVRTEAQGVTPAAESTCGTVDVTVTPNDPSNTGWFHEELEWDDVPRVIISGDWTVTWHNYSTGGGNQYTFEFAGIYVSWSGDHDVYTKHGEIGWYWFGTGSVNVDDEGWLCVAGPTSMRYFDD